MASSARSRPIERGEPLRPASAGNEAEADLGLREERLLTAGVAQVVDSYVSREHRDGRGDGCTVAALSGDAARQPADLKGEFAAGIENLLTALQASSDTPEDVDQRAARTRVINILAHSIGAIMLSRACPDDSPLADEILDACRKEILASLAHDNSDQPAARGTEV